MPLAARTIELLPLESQAGTVDRPASLVAARNWLYAAWNGVVSGLERSAEGLEGVRAEEDKADNFTTKKLDHAANASP